MLFCILQINPLVIHELSKIICSVLIFDTQISAMEKTLTQGGAITIRSLCTLCLPPENITVL